MNIEQKILLAFTTANIVPMVLIHTNGDVMDLEITDESQNYLVDTTIRAGYGAILKVDGKDFLVVSSIPLRVTCCVQQQNISSVVLDSQYFSDFIDDEPTWAVLEATDTIDATKLSAYINEKLWVRNSDINLNHLNHKLDSLIKLNPPLNEDEINKELAKNEDLLMRNLDQMALKCQLHDAVA